MDYLNSCEFSYGGIEVLKPVLQTGIEIALRICVAQIGARRHYAVPVALYRAGLLSVFHTDWCANRGWARALSAVLPQTFVRGRLRRLYDRRVPSIPERLIETHQWHGAKMLWARRHHDSNESFWACANAAFGQSVVKRGFGDADAVYGFNAAAVEILAAAKQRGLRTILDQTMAPWKCVEGLLCEERQRWPEWASPDTEGDQRGVLADRESQEWSKADLIICGSAYVAQGVADAGGPADRCHVVPYGYDVKTASMYDGPTTTASEALRVLFVGTVDLRKGLPYLHEAAGRIDRTIAEFRVVGPIRVPESTVRRLSQQVDVVGPVPRSDVSRHYQWADVVLLPTLAEGSANVCYEAMSHGVPVITTLNAGSVIRDGIDGWIVPIRSADAIADCLAHLAGHRDALHEASRHAYERASEFTWDRYMNSLAEVISRAVPIGENSESVSVAH